MRDAFQEGPDGGSGIEICSERGKRKRKKEPLTSGFMGKLCVCACSVCSLTSYHHCKLFTLNMSHFIINSKSHDELVWIIRVSVS